MSDFFDEEKKTEEENSSIFSDPAKKPEKANKFSAKSKRLISLCLGILAVGLIVAAAVTVKLKIKPKDTDNSASDSKQIEVIAHSQSDITTVEVKNKNGTFSFYKKTEPSSDSSSSDTVRWCVSGVGESLTDSSAAGNIVSSAATVSAEKEIEKMSASQCGLETPLFTVNVTLDDGSTYSLFVGNTALSNDGYYFSSSETGDKIYLVKDSAVNAFDFELLDLADSSSFEAAAFSADISSYKSSSGTLSSFDELSVSGKSFEKPLVIRPNTDESSSSVASFITVSPISGFADNTDKLLQLFSSSTTVAGAYSLDINPETLKKFGLDSPDYVVSVSVAGEKKTFKISKVDDEYCAVINDESKIVKKVSNQYLSVVGTKAEDYYLKMIAPYMLSSLSEFDVSLDGQDYIFSVSSSEDEDGKTTFEIKLNGEKINESGFQDFYAVFVGLSVTDYETANTEKPACTVKLKFSGNKSDMEISFCQVSATRYKALVNGQDKGNITLSDYNKFTKALKKIIK